MLRIINFVIVSSCLKFIKAKRRNKRVKYRIKNSIYILSTDQVSLEELIFLNENVNFDLTMLSSKVLLSAISTSKHIKDTPA